MRTKHTFAFLALLLLFCDFTAVMPAQQSSPAGAAMTTSAPEVQEFQKIENGWSNAINSRDQYALELVLSPLLVDVSSSGDIATRDQRIASLISNSDKTLNVERRVITVRMLGDVAVVNGTYALHHQVDNKPVEEKGVFTHVFQRSRGRWMCVNAQQTAVLKDSPEKGKKAHESRFHLP